MVLKIEHTQKIITPEIPGYYYSREKLIEKISSYESKRLILITAPAGYGKTSFSVEYFHKLKKDLKLWISLSPYDNSIENFFLLLAIAFEKNFTDSKFGKNLKKVISGSQNVSLDEKINNVISSFSSDLFQYLKNKNKRLYIFLDDFHNIDASNEVCAALNYFLEYLPSNINIVFVSRRDPKKINYPKFLAKNWLGRITKEDLSFTLQDIENFLKAYTKKTEQLDKVQLEEFLKTTEGWVTAIQLFIMSDDRDLLKERNHGFSRNEIFDYFTNEIYEEFTDKEKNLLLKLSFPESFSRHIIENVMKIKSGYSMLTKLYEKNVFINREDETYRFHELLREYLNKIAIEQFTEKEIRDIYNQIGTYYLKNKEWREVYIALNYLIKAKNHETLRNWIRMNASDKLLLIHSSGLYSKIEEIQDKKFKESLEYILLKISTLIYKDKNIDKAITYLKNIIYSGFSTGDSKNYLIPVNKIKPADVNYYIELLMLICNCNFYREGIGKANIEISEHILKFRLKTEQEIQFIVSLIKSYITTGDNRKSKKYIVRLKEIFSKIARKKKGDISEDEENSLVESAFSLLIFFDYGDYKTGNKVVEYILNNFDMKNFDLSNYSQMCFALFASYNFSQYENFYNLLEKRNNEKNRTIFSTYKNQFEFQSILRMFLNYEFKKVITELEVLKKSTFQKNYIYFIDSLILYCYNLLGEGQKVINLLEENVFNISSTRKLILSLEASLITNDKKLYREILKEINSLKIINFTLFNQAVIYFCESCMHAKNGETAKFKNSYMKFLGLCEEYEFDNYIHFRASAGKLKKVFVYAYENRITNKYIEKILPYKKLKEASNKVQLKILIEFLNGNRIFINNIELTDNLWQRPKSKSIFLYIVYNAVMNIDISKESLIDDMLYSSKDVKYDAIADVEINKVRKTLQVFISELVSESIIKDILIIKGKKYLLTSENIDLEIETDVERFKSLSSSSNISDKYSAINLYKTDFGEGLYQNWAEDIRENLRYVYSETIHKLIAYYEDMKETEIVIRLLERLVESEFSDDDTMLKLFSIYNEEKDYRKIKFMYRLYEKRLKNEFNVQPSVELKKIYQDLIPGS
ncbi:MAG TPA: hypothetical protein PKA90_09595 [Ignavibacteria bacterium]|nr:hypothetical protein [Ignavibacteria bacterium]HMR40668.1 hypothetical protein [Ignavibacteria bacterium]